ncbi:MAG: hypothetical protein JO053_01510 [Acidobacteria bacterium]|nr:hypothetical protein [Acidobacteriota bacterium]
MSILINPFMFAAAGGGGPGIALVAHTGAGSGNGNDVTTSGIDTTGGGSLIVEAWAKLLAGSGSNGDNQGNTYSNVASFVGNSPGAQMAYKKGGTVGSGHTFNFSGGSGGYPAICGAAFSGAKTTGGADDHNEHTQASGTTIQAGSVTPLVDGSVVIIFVGTSGTAVANSIDSGFTLLDSIAGDNTYKFGGHMFYKILGSGTAGVAVNPTITLSASCEATAVAAVFPPA